MRAVVGVVALLLAMLMAGALADNASACGGLFCQNTPVDQNAERIIFTDNGDGTISAIIQIQYTGSAPDFSWILPLPSAITADDIAVPETGTEAFLELERFTNPQIIPPPVPEDCAQVAFEMAAAVEEEVTVFASGEVGPFGFDVVGSEDPTAMIRWLRDNEYRVTESMEPLIDVYVEEQFVFLAMRLLPEQGVQDIQPVQVTYESDRPMIPLRLTAVAANPDMAVIVWFFGQAQATPTNYAKMKIDDDDLVFFWPFGGNNYRQLMGQLADDFNGQAFVTEYAGPSRELSFTDPLLIDLASKHPYLTRLNTVISPEEMTVDPEFDYDASLSDVSNVRDLSSRDRDQYECERVESGLETIVLPFITAGKDDGGPFQIGDGEFGLRELAFLILGGCICLGALGLVGALVISRRRR